MTTTTTTQARVTRSQLMSRIAGLKGDLVARRHFIEANLNKLAPFTTPGDGLKWWYEHGTEFGRHYSYRASLTAIPRRHSGARSTCEACWQTRLAEYVSRVGA